MGHTCGESQNIRIFAQFLIQNKTSPLFSSSSLTRKIMSDSEDFSEDEGGKQKFQPTLSVEDQPLEVIKRVKALKKLQFENIKHEVRYYEECHKLDLKYEALYAENNRQRQKIMKFLQDVTISLPPENTSFTITFHFAPNQFFTNKELTKEYLMKNTFDPEDPLDFDGPEIYKSKGCKIDWKAGKNTTVKV